MIMTPQCPEHEYAPYLRQYAPYMSMSRLRYQLPSRAFWALRVLNNAQEL